MTTPTPPAPATPAAPAPAAATAPRPAAAPAPAAPGQALTAALSAAVAAIARHITGTEPGHEHQALAMLGLTAAQAEAITGKPVT